MTQHQRLVVYTSYQDPTGSVGDGYLQSIKVCPYRLLMLSLETWNLSLTEEEKEDFKPVLSGLKKGHASFYHPLMVHGSYANK